MPQSQQQKLVSTAHESALIATGMRLEERHASHAYATGGVPLSSPLSHHIEPSACISQPALVDETQMKALGKARGAGWHETSLEWLAATPTQGGLPPHRSADQEAQQRALGNAAAKAAAKKSSEEH